ncbi:hypothetical protein PR202_ga16049 [Eleusine coracana subsp. coracana]|uniref:Uncharacterized protein n=1 Tax=Eleusine coracana subsp. coracana TaxID=191504 RepID=A0AAV5CLR7_ELECO|nr:hypothetical protein PR202_ga16049 [Eleusine coracana subsp. coracana]
MDGPTTSTLNRPHSPTAAAPDQPPTTHASGAHKHRDTRTTRKRRIASKNPTFLHRASVKIQPFPRIRPNHAGHLEPAARSRRIGGVSRSRNTSLSSAPSRPRSPTGHWHSNAEQEPLCSQRGTPAWTLLLQRLEWRRRGEGSGWWRRWGEWGISEAKEKE